MKLKKKIMIPKSMITTTTKNGRKMMIGKYKVEGTEYKAYKFIK